ncbi:MAG: DUF4111 domain-containing protein [Lachnospiraceae bacterium]|nr:DUF4111 domain-containing protein [Lachnospiraceae bacterium]MBQ8233755.1 DUF4111 domain-containing protein [Lachnospiraceae bacterium]
MSYQMILEKIVDTSKQIFRSNLTGVYLHGSIVMGCFNPDKSDIDLIIVVEDNITDEQKMQFMKEVVELDKSAPSKGIELSIVKKTYCKEFLYPTPFELHFSNTHLQWFIDNPTDYISKMKGTDKDLAAHFTIINHCGITLYGEGIASIFSEVPKADYIDSIWADIEGAKEEILEIPMYMILNLCRVVAYLKKGLVTSKKQGGEWGKQNLEPRYQSLISEALKCYASDEKMVVEAAEAQAFAEYMLELIKTLR